MKKWTYARWFCIAGYMASLYFVWQRHIPVRNIFLFLLIFVVLTCFMLIIMRLIPQNREKGEN